MQYGSAPDVEDYKGKIQKKATGFVPFLLDHSIWGILCVVNGVPEDSYMSI